MRKKLIFYLLLIIIILSSILICKINKTYSYDPQVYNEVYEEYSQIKDSIPNNNNNNNSDSTTITDSYSSDSEYNPVHSYNKPTFNNRTTGIIDIPKINISYPIIEDYSEENLNIAPTKVVGPSINEVGNLVIAAHNNRNENFFSNLHELEIDDIVNLTDPRNKTKTYRVYKKYQVNQTDLSCLNQDTNGKVELTLITCVKFNNSKRLIVKCVAL